jgi:hypothetical protein
MKKLLFYIACMILMSCKEDEKPELSFISCNLDGQNLQVIKNNSGTLTYTDKLGSYPLSEFSYYIIVGGELPLEICNMPSSLKLAEGEVKNVVFSGEMVILPFNADAISSTIQLSDLKFR